MPETHISLFLATYLVASEGEKRHVYKNFFYVQTAYIAVIIDFKYINMLQVFLRLRI